MPAAKDMSLNKGHFTKNQIENREKQKASVTPSVSLKAPEIIKTDVRFMRIWKDTLKLYKGTQLLNALDGDMLARYCIEKHNLQELYKEREAYRKTGYSMAYAVKKPEDKAKNEPPADKAISWVEARYKFGPGVSQEAGEDVAEAGGSNEIKITPEAYLDTLLRLETRIEAKTKLLNQMALALYMTPRARAGAVPMKPDKEPVDGNADMFD
jgi:hypothetical protein